MSEDDEVFKDVCRLLDSHNINFWICHGTLLGIIREGRLLPWDHDIDFAVWDGEISREDIINIFANRGYKQELVFGDVDCLHFYGRNKKIDISFYKRKNNTASIKWVAPSKSYSNRFYLYCIGVICRKSGSCVDFSRSIFKALPKILLNSFLKIVGVMLRNKFKDRLYAHSHKYRIYTGYEYPLNLMSFKRIEYNGNFVQIPTDAEKCLELTYGLNWKIPKKEYVWYEEANNLADIKGG